MKSLTSNYLKAGFTVSLICIAISSRAAAQVVGSGPPPITLNCTANFALNSTGYNQYPATDRRCIVDVVFSGTIAPLHKAVSCIIQPNSTTSGGGCTATLAHPLNPAGTPMTILSASAEKMLAQTESQTYGCIETTRTASVFGPASPGNQYFINAYLNHQCEG